MRTFVASIVALGGLAVSFGGVGDPVGFGGPEIFPIDPRIGQLISADVNQDGLADLVLSNPRRSRLQVLYNQSGIPLEDRGSPEGREGDVNALPMDARFRLESISTEEKVTSLVVGDFVGDSMLDIVYVGNLEELVLLENGGNNGWIESNTWSFPDIADQPRAIQRADTDGDRQDELILLTESSLILLEPGKRASRPIRLGHHGMTKGVLVVDVNRDGCDDLLCQPQNDARSLWIRLGSPEGVAVFQRSVDVGMTRFVGVTDEEQGSLVTIALRSGRAKVGRITVGSQSSEGARSGEGQLSRLALPGSNARERAALWSDVNRDGRKDLLASDGDAGRLLVYLQKEHQTFSAPEAYSAYGGIRQIRATDWNQDDAADVFVLSATENQVGVTQWHPTTGLGFPQPIRMEGTPLGIALGSLTESDQQQLVILSRTETGTRLWVMDAVGQRDSYEIDGAIDAGEVELVLHDADQDGHQDIVVLAPYERTMILRQDPGARRFERIRLRGGSEDLERPWVARIDLDGDKRPELIVPQRNAIRGMVLEAVKSSESSAVEWRSHIQFQINGEAAQSEIAGAAWIPATKGSPAQVCLLDRGMNQLSFQQRSADGQWRLARTLRLPKGGFEALNEGSVFLGETASLCLWTRQACYLKALSGPSAEFQVEGTYESQLTGAFLRQCIGGDLDGDNVNELVFLETSKHHLELVAGDPEAGYRLQYRWPVFEERTFRARRNEGAEPREAVIDDFTGDARPDLALIVHDRVLLYPQD